MNEIRSTSSPATDETVATRSVADTALGAPGTTKTEPKEQPRRFIGVCRAGNGRWKARLRNRGPKETVGYFATAEEAAAAYDQRAYALRGEAAALNFERGPDGKPDVSRRARSRPKPVGDGLFTSRFVGVWRQGAAWHTSIKISVACKHYIGAFAAEEDAAVAFDRAAYALRGDGATLNFHRGADGLPDPSRPTGARREDAYAVQRATRGAAAWTFKLAPARAAAAVVAAAAAAADSAPVLTDASALDGSPSQPARRRRSDRKPALLTREELEALAVVRAALTSGIKRLPFRSSRAARSDAASRATDGDGGGFTVSAGAANSSSSSSSATHGDVGGVQVLQPSARSRGGSRKRKTDAAAADAAAPSAAA